MGRVSPVFLSILLFVAWVCGVARAHADPIRVTSGHFGGFGIVGGLGSGDGGGIELFGPDGIQLLGSSFEGVVSSIRLINLSTIPAQNALVDFSSVLTVLEGGAPIFAPDASGRALATPSLLSFVASPTQLVCQNNVFRGVVCGGVAPFTFHANLMFDGNPSFVGSPLTLDLTGGGTVTAEFFGEAVLLDYEFEASPTPEPATASLLATGVIMSGAEILRRRRGVAAQRRPVWVRVIS